MIKSEKDSNQEKAPSAWIQFGVGGHEKEYLVHLEGYDIDNFIPDEIVREIEKELGEEWAVSNRGTRLEIVNKKKYGTRDDATVHRGIQTILSERGFVVTE